MRSIILRRTHASRLFSLPIIKLPDIGERTVEATLCDVEQVIYNRIFSIYIDNFNGECKMPDSQSALLLTAWIGMPRNKGLGRYLCLLDMILKLRMFSSHPLTIQPMLKLMLTDELMRQLIILSNQKKDNEHPSSKITRWLITLRKHITIPAKSGQPVKDQSNEAGQQNLENQEGQTPEPAQYLQGDREKLVRQFHAFMDQLHDDEQWMERFQRTTCPLCEMFPEEAIITSCKHLYCEECYCVLRGEHGLSGAGKPVCQRCDVDIEEAAHCGLINEFPLNVSESTPPSTSISQTQPSKKKRQPKGKKIQMTNRGTQGPFLSTFKSTGQPEPAPEEVNEDESTDWVALAAREMPGAKLTKVREVAANWIAENKEVKVVIFTQFLENVRILVAMCMKENWEYACVRTLSPFPLPSYLPNSQTNTGIVLL